MNTMMDLLVSLHRMDRAAEAAEHNCQLSPGEKKAVRRHMDLIREVVPANVLVQYEKLKTTASELNESPVLLATAVLLRAYRGSPSSDPGRRPSAQAAADSRAQRVTMRAD